MAKIRVLVETSARQPEAFSAHRTASLSSAESFRQAEKAARNLAGLQLEVEGDFPPVPMFSDTRDIAQERAARFAAFARPESNQDEIAQTIVVGAVVDERRLAELSMRPGVRVFANSRLTLFSSSLFGTVPYRATIDCRPFEAPVTVELVRQRLGVQPFFEAGIFGEEVVVGILDEGVNGDTYPVLGGFARSDSLQPGAAAITSHGSMCAADVLVAAPGAVIFDYPFLGQPTSGGALAMFQQVLDDRRRRGVPHITSNSYGFVGLPQREGNEHHEVYDLNHPLHRKIREVVASGCAVFFAAGNCGAQCPSGKCMPSGVGPGRSIHAANSLSDVITVAAVNGNGQRIGYSSQGPGMFEPRKPDISCFSHFYGNFGPGCPGGQSVVPFDNGTSAATPVAAGVAALLTSALGLIPPALLKAAMLESALGPGGRWNRDTGFGMLNASATYRQIVGKLQRAGRPHAATR